MEQKYPFNWGGLQNSLFTEQGIYMFLIHGGHPRYYPTDKIRIGIADDFLYDGLIRKENP